MKPFFKKHKKFGKYSEYGKDDYISTSFPVQVGNSLVFKVNILNKKRVQFKGKLELRLVCFDNLDQYSACIFSLMMYMNGL